MSIELYAGQEQFIRDRTHEIIDCLQNPAVSVRGYQVTADINRVTLEEGWMPRMSSVILAREGSRMEFNATFAKWRRGAEEVYGHTLVLGTNHNSMTELYIRGDPAHRYSRTKECEVRQPQQEDLQWAKGLLWAIDHAIKTKRPHRTRRVKQWA